MVPRPDNKQTIAVDVDDVLAAENETVRMFVNETFGTNHSAEDYSIEAPYWGYWERVWRVSDEEARRRYLTYLESGVHRTQMFVNGAAEAIRKLKKDYDLVVITSRNDKLFGVTREWLNEHFPDTFRSVEFVLAWGGDKKATKATIAKEIRADYLIDDNAEHCNLAAEADIKALLFGDYGWNRKEMINPAVLRVKNWQEALEYFNDKS